MKELKVVIDTNVLVSILKGSRGLLLIYTAFKLGRFKLVIGAEVLEELAAVLYRPRLQIDPKDIRELFRLIKMKAIRVKPRTQLTNVCRDPKDDLILELAIESKADLIITGDKDLLALKSFHGIPVIKPKEFLNKLRK